MTTAPMLVSVGGLPATGKTTVARALASGLGAAYVRIDTIETAIDRAEGDARRTNGWDCPPGYEVGYDVAADQLRVGLDVVAESVNASAVTRDAWRATAERVGARLVEVVCSDPDEHRRRAEQREIDIPGLTKPTWEQISNREYHPWDRDRVVIDTAGVAVDDAVRRAREAIGA